MTTQTTETTTPSSPVSDVTYDLMQALTSKLEAIEAYEMYREDADGEVRQLFEDLLADERQHAERLLQALRREMGAAG
jgi:rubrerythrin